MINIDFTVKPKEDTPNYVAEKFGCKYTFDNNRELHSFNDNPAAINEIGDKFWYKHGKLHRDNDLPAIVYENGSKTWYLNGFFTKVENK